MTTRWQASKFDVVRALRLRSDISVPTVQDMYDIPTYRRKWGMIVAVYLGGVLEDIDTEEDVDLEDEVFYWLNYGLSSTDIRDNGNWQLLEFGRIVPEFRFHDGWLQWKYEHESDDYWRDLFYFLPEDVDFASGLTPELREHEGWVQWRYADQDPEDTWKDLFEVPSDGRTPEFRVEEGWVQWKYTDEEVWTDMFPVPVDGVDGTDGEDGEHGRTPELRTHGGWVQWKYTDEGEEAWTNLFLVPSDGLTPEFREHDGWVQWKYTVEGEGDWRDLYEIPVFDADFDFQQVQSDWLEEDTESPAYIQNKPDIPDFEDIDFEFDPYEYWTLEGKQYDVTLGYGFHYNWYAVNDERNIAAAGWRVPQDDDFPILRAYYDSEGNDWSNTAGGHLKETGTDFWDAPNTDATNTDGFNARGAGAIDGAGAFYLRKETCYFWHKEESGTNPNNALFSSLLHDSNTFHTGWLGGASHSTTPKTYGFSVRLVKESTTLSHGETGIYVGNDGKVYPTVCIGTQEWLAHDLCETRYRDGNVIQEVDTVGGWGTLTEGAYRIEPDAVAEVDVQQDVESKDIVSVEGADDINVTVERIEGKHVIRVGAARRITDLENVQSDWLEEDINSPAFILNKPDIPEDIDFEQVQSDWLEEDIDSPAYIQNKPEVPDFEYATGEEIDTGTDNIKVVAPSGLTDSTYKRIHVGPSPPEGNEEIWIKDEEHQQVQSDWLEEDTESPAYIQNKPDIPDLADVDFEQVQSDWLEEDTESPAFIKNKPEIPDPSDVEGAATYDELTDTPASKTGKAMHLVQVADNEQEHEYVDSKTLPDLGEDEYWRGDGSNIIAVKDLVVESPNGTRYRITVDNSGVLGTEEIT